MRLAIVALFAWLLPTAGWTAEQFLAPEVAFRSDAAAAGPRTIELRFEVAPGYYLYEEQFRFEANGAQFGAPLIPPGQSVFDATFGKRLQTHRGVVRIALPVERSAAEFRLAATYQGCSEKGLCYPPMQMRADVSLDAADGAIRRVRVLAGREMQLADSVSPQSAASDKDESRIQGALREGRLLPVIALFFAAGLLLSLTPCVLPMLPILSSIIVGQRAPVSRTRGVSLAASYSLGVAIVYTAFGLAAGLAGEGLAANLQNPWVLGGFAALLAGLALSSLRGYPLALPTRLAAGLAGVSRRLPGGRFGGVFLMGGISALIVSPCVAAPLAGALVYLSQTGDATLGGAALFSLASGMSVPLLLVGASAGALLPKAGRWMAAINRFFAVLLLATAIWTLQPVVAPPLALAMWGVLAFVAALLALRSAAEAAKLSRAVYASIGIVAAAAGVAQFVGAASGAANPLRPLERLASGRFSQEEPRPLDFRMIRSSADLDRAIADADRPVVLDFYADWCVSCREMEERTFSVPSVQARLGKAVLLKADVTRNTEADRELLRRFNLFGPPGTLFFDRSGREIAGTRVIGYQDSRRFERTLDAANL